MSNCGAPNGAEDSVRRGFFIVHPVISASAAPAISKLFIFVLFVIIPYQPAKLVKVFYFRYGIYPGPRPDVPDVKAAALIMLSALAE